MKQKFLSIIFFGVVVILVGVIAYQVFTKDSEQLNIKQNSIDPSLSQSSSVNTEDWKIHEEGEWQVKYPNDWFIEFVQADVLFLSPEKKQELDQYKNSLDSKDSRSVFYFGVNVSYDKSSPGLSNAIASSIEFETINGIEFTSYRNNELGYQIFTYQTMYKGKMYKLSSVDQESLEQIVSTFQFIK